MALPSMLSGVGPLSTLRLKRPQEPQQPQVAPSPFTAPPMVGVQPIGGQQPVLIGGGNQPTAPTPPPPPAPAGIPLNDLPPGQPGPLQEFGPGNDLRTTQINPYTGARLGGIQSGNDVLYKSLTEGPSLSDAAAEQYRLLGEQGAEQRQLGVRNIGQAAARLGRLGSGMVTTDLGNLEDVLQTRENQARRGLAADVAYGEAANRRANLGAGQSYEGDVYNQGVGARNEARGERGYQQDLATQAMQMDLLRRQMGLDTSANYGARAGAGEQSAADILGSALAPEPNDLLSGSAQNIGAPTAASYLQPGVGKYDPRRLRR